jgi:uncharacterized cofD-like protein
MSKDQNKKVVTIGGGSGQFVLLSGLRDLDNVDITAVVSMVDSGGSTGRLRDEYGVLPPGDILKCVLALSPHRESAREILQKRFKNNYKLADHSAGNMLLTMLSGYCNDFAEGVSALGEILDIKGRVLPVTIDKATLVAELTDGTWLFGESAIDVPRGDQREKIKRTFLVPHYNNSIKVYPEVLKSIKEADLIILGPGDLYTSIIPNLLVPGVGEEIKNSPAELVYIVNIMSKFGETDNFLAWDFVEKIEEYLPRQADRAIFNSQKPASDIIQRYEEQKAYYVEPPPGEQREEKIIKRDLLNVSGGVVRHDDAKLAQVIEKLLSVL